MDHKGYINLVLPGHGLILDYGPTDNLLRTMGTSVKEMIEMFIAAWAEYKSVDMHYTCNNGPLNLDEDWGPGFTQLRTHAHWMVMDIVFENAFMRFERGEIEKMSKQDMRDAESIMLSLWDSLSSYIFELLIEMGAHEGQISLLRFVRWIGDDFIISLPRRTTAIALKQQIEFDKRQKEFQASLDESRQEEKQFVQNLRDRSPLCYYRSDRVNDLSE
ncbi:hypothetical protein [Xanthomonas phage RTH11]|nr:hypothetical protein [Xanthomonas phage RTH11]